MNISALNVFSPSEYEKLKTLLKNPEDDFQEIVSLLEKKVEESTKQLKDLDERYHSLIDSLTHVGIGLDIVSDNYKVLFQNQVLKERFGDCREKNCYSSYMGLENPCVFCPMEKVLKYGRVERIELKSADGRFYELISAPYPNQDGTIDKVAEVVIDITDREHVEQKLKYHLELEQLISKLSSEFINISSREIDDKITKTLEEIAKFSNTVRASLFLVSKDLIRITNTHEWCSDPNDSQIHLLQDIPFETFGYYKNILEKHNLVSIGHPDDLPLEAKGEWEWIKVYGFRPLLFIPIIYQGALYGTIGFYGRVNEEREWSEHFITVLKFMGNNLVNLLERNKAEQELKKSEEKLRLIFEGSYNLISITDSSAKPLWANPAWVNIFGPIKKYKELPLQLIHPEDREKSTRLWNMLVSGETAKIFLEYQYEIKPGRYKTFESSAFSLSIEKEERFCVIARDITERKQAEQKLKESEERYRILFNNSPVGIGLSTFDGRVITMNKSMEELSSYTIEQFNKVNLRETYVDFNQRELMLNLLKEHGKVRDYEVKLKRKDSTEFNALLNIDLIELDGEEILLTNMRDITQIKNAEQKLRESEEKFRLMAEQAVVGIFIIQDYKFPYVNNKLAEITGYSVEEMLSWRPKELFKLFHPGDLEFIREQGEKKLRGDLTAVKHYQYRSIRKNGEIVWLDHYSKNAQYQGRSAILGIIVDINDKVKAEQKLKESEEKFRNITNQSLIGIGIVQDSIIKYVNKKFADIFGYTVEEMLNWSPEEFMITVHPDDKEFVFDQVKKKLSGSEEYLENYEFRGLKKSGEIIWIENYTKTIMYEGRVADFVAFIDITERINAQQELVKLNHLKSELLRRTSHELKTPLVSIKGFSELLLEVHRDKLDALVISTINEIKQGCLRLENLIGDILKTAELESGTIELHKSEENLSFLVRVCVNEIKGFSKLRNHTINLKLHDKLVTQFEKEQIHQVISNLLNNAVKYTPPNGLIEIKSDIKNDFIILSIQENGIGFTEEEKTRIFKQFGKIERYGQGLDIVAEGSGFGLFISKKIIELHGGDIWVESEGRNKGSTFYISLPLI